MASRIGKKGGPPSQNSERRYVLKADAILSRACCKGGARRGPGGKALSTDKLENPKTLGGPQRDTLRREAAEIC